MHDYGKKACAGNGATDYCWTCRDSFDDVSVPGQVLVNLARTPLWCVFSTALFSGAWKLSFSLERTNGVSDVMILLAFGLMSGEGGSAHLWFFLYPPCHGSATTLLFSPSSSGCPEAVKLLIGSKSDLPPEVDVAQVRVSRRPCAHREHY